MDFVNKKEYCLVNIYYGTCKKIIAEPRSIIKNEFKEIPSYMRTLGLLQITIVLLLRALFDCHKLDTC